MSDSDLVIRSYQTSDRDAVIDLWERCGLVVWYNDPQRDLDLLLATPTADVFVGTLSDRVIATSSAGFDGHRGWLYYVAVEPDFRAGGYGRRIVRYAEAWLKRQNAPKVQLIIRNSNLGIRAFYKDLGYEKAQVQIYQRWLRDLGPAPGTETREDGKLENVITYLEMTERPTLPDRRPPKSSKVALLRARQPPIGFYRYLYAAVGDPCLWYERRLLSDEEMTEIIHDDLVEIYVLYVDGTPAGYFELDRRRTSEIELTHFGLTPDFIGKGLGGYLLVSSIDTAWSYSPGRFMLHTNSLDHPRALPLYQRMGFKPYKQVRHLIDDPRVTGLIPKSDPGQGSSE